MRAKYSNKVLRLKHGETVQLKGIPQSVTFRNGEEFHIVHDVVYMQGHPLEAGWQKPVIDWIEANPQKFVDDTRIFRNA